MSIKDKQISVGVAKGWTENWREKYPECKAFVVPVEDLMGCLEEMNVLTSKKCDGETVYVYNPGIKRDIRAYMGYDDELKRYHMVMVGTKRFVDARYPTGHVYRDIYNGGVDGKSGTLDVPYLSDPSGSGVFDFSEPCPDWCDDESLLNG